jgi:MoaA/NifB/PqqE/SkfB family radical SAM enzyme
MEAYKVFQLGISYAQSLFAYHTNGAPKPFSASYVVTNKCNLRCTYCNFPYLKEPELNLAQIETLFVRLRKMGVVRLGLLGGEPLVRKDIGEIISMAHKMGFFVSLNTNLLLYKQFKNKLNPVDYYLTSLDGTKEKHITNRGKQDYDAIIDAIRDIVSDGKKITAIAVVTDTDRESTDYLLDLAHRESFNIHFQPEGYNAVVAGRNAPDKMEHEKIRDYWLYLLQKQKEGAPITTSAGYLKYVSNWADYRSSALFDPEQRCAAGRGFLFVDTSGLAYPCCYTKGRVKAVDLLNNDWADHFNPQTPCTKCIAGPFLEYNLLFEKPVSSSLAALHKVI